MTLTPIAPAEVVRLLAHAYRVTFGGWPSRRALENAWAVIAHENAAGARIWDHNWGNLGAGSTWTGPTWTHPDTGQRFRSYPDHATGARVWWTVLADRFPAVLVALEGPPAGATLAGELYRSRYVVGGDPSVYAAGLGRHWVAFRPAWAGGVTPSGFRAAGWIVGSVAAAALAGYSVHRAAR